MADDLGTVRVSIEEEGTQEAADTIAEASAEGEGGIAGGNGDGAGGGIGGLLGGISAKLAGILGFVAFLASLKPIQELLGGLQRLFSVAILPLVALLNAFLRPILQKLLRFIGGLDFSSLEALFRSFGEQIDKILSDTIQKVTGLGQGQAQTASENIQTGLELSNAFFNPSEPITGTDVATAGQAGTNFLENQLNIDLSGILQTEQSPTASKQRTAEATTEQNQNNKPGSE